MDHIIDILVQVVKPLADPAIILSCLIGGVFFGAIYDRKQGLPSTMAYHYFFVGWVFIFTVFLFRFIEAGATVGSVLGWLGIGLLWGVYCLCIWIATKIKFI